MIITWKKALIQPNAKMKKSSLTTVEQTCIISMKYFKNFMEWFGLEGTLKGQLVQPPHGEQGHLHLDQVAQSPVQPDLECFQGWGIYHLSGQPLAVFHHPHCKKFLPYIQSKSILF